MKIKSERDFWSGLMFIAVGVGFAIGATNYSMGPACPPNDPCAANLWARMSQLSRTVEPVFRPPWIVNPLRVRAVTFMSTPLYTDVCEPKLFDHVV